MLNVSHLHAFAVIVFFVAMSGCGPGPIKHLKTKPGYPWCAPGKQIQAGERSMGKSFYGDIWQRYWVDNKGKVHDPEKLGEKVWDYLKTTGDVARIDQLVKANQCTDQMRIVSINPVVVLTQPCQHKRFENTPGWTGHGTDLGIELAYAADDLMFFDEPIKWLSPDLKQPPKAITFNASGVAEISLGKGNGKLILTHEGEFLKVTRQ